MLKRAGVKITIVPIDFVHVVEYAIVNIALIKLNHLAILKLTFLQLHSLKMNVGKVQKRYSLNLLFTVIVYLTARRDFKGVKQIRLVFFQIINYHIFVLLYCVF
jgi:hypothetical protein